LHRVAGAVLPERVRHALLLLPELPRPAPAADQARDRLAGPRFLHQAHHGPRQPPPQAPGHETGQRTRGGDGGDPADLPAPPGLIARTVDQATATAVGATRGRGERSGNAKRTAAVATAAAEPNSQA